MNSESGAGPNRDRPAGCVPDPSEPGSVIPPAPVFIPDPRTSARIARARYTMLVLTAVLVLVALVVLVGYRPRFVPAKQVPGVDESSVPAGVSAPVQGRTRAAPVAAPVPADPVSRTRAELAVIDGLVRASNDHWLRAQELLPPGADDSAGVVAAISGLRRAVVLADSAVAEVAEAGRRAAQIRVISSEPDAKRSAYGISLVYTSADRYLRAVAADAADRRSYLSVTGEALAALRAGDGGEYQTKANVANSHRYRSENRQRTIRRLAEQLAQAERELR